MAVIAFLFGSVIGVFCGLIGFFGFGLGAIAALSLYMGLSLVIGFGVILLSLPDQDPHFGNVEV